MTSHAPDAMGEKLPRMRVAFACLVDATHFYAICSLFSYAGVLCADLEWVNDRNSAGFAAGWLQSSNVFGRVLTSSVWGYIAARYGFDVVFTITLASLFVGGLLFGFCTSLVLAMLVRSIFFGVLNGWAAVFGPYCATVAGEKRQAEVIGMVIAAGNGMQLVGPAVSGWTYQLIPEFPALAPSMIGSCLASLAFCLFCLLHFRDKKTSKSVKNLPEGSEGSATATKRSITQLLCRWPVPLIICMRFSQGFALFAIFEVFPLWLISEQAVGGLNMSEKQVGFLLARSGIWSILYFTFVFPRLTKKLGGRCTSIIVSVLGIIFSTLLPFCTSEWTANLAHMLAASSIFSQFAVNVTFTNNAAGPADRAIISGFAVTVDTVGKAIAPIATSTIFAWSIRTFGMAGHGLVFYIQAALSLVNLLFTLPLPASVENAHGGGENGQEQSSEGTIYGASETETSEEGSSAESPRC